MDEFTPDNFSGKNGGSYITGFLGALTGALTGAVPMAFLLYYGIYASYIGIVIGLFAYLGYRLFNGRNGKGKAPVIIVCSLLGVIAGNLAADAVSIYISIKSGGLSPLSEKDVLPAIVYLLSNGGGYLSDCLLNIFTGFAFSFIGMSGLLKKPKTEAQYDEYEE